MTNILRNTISILIIILLVLFISIFFFDFNPIEKTKARINQIKYERSLNKTIVDNKTLIVDTPHFIYSRFDDITYTIHYEEDETTDFVVVDFTDDSSYLNRKCYSVIQRTKTRDKILCSECSNKTTGKIYCSIYDYEEGLMFGSFYAYAGKESKYINSDDIFKLVKDYIEENNP